MVTTALTFYSLLDIPTADMVECFKAAENAGFTYGFMSESAGRDAMMILTATALATSRLKLGTNILPIYRRTPAQTAASAITLSEIANGRFTLLGLGTSYKQRVEAWFGTEFERPAARMREYIEVIRLLLSGGSQSYTGTYYKFEDYPPLTETPHPIPIYLGVTGPVMRRLTGRMADGVILNSLSTPEFIRRSIDIIKAGADEKGRSLSDIDIGASIVFSADPDRTQALEAAKRAVLFYIIYPEFDPIVETTPYMDEIKALREAHWSGDRDKAYRVLTEPIVDAFTVFGTPDECREKIERYKAAGLQLFVIRSAVDRFNGKQAVLTNIEAMKGFA